MNLSGTQTNYDDEKGSTIKIFLSVKTSLNQIILKESHKIRKIIIL